MQQAPPRSPAHDQDGARPRKFVVALGRGLSILEAFARDETWLSSGAVAALVGLPRPTVSRLLQSLATDGYLVYSTRRRQYRLGTAILGLGYAARTTSNVSDVVQPHLSRLADAYNVHASLVGRDGLDVVQLEVSHSRNTLMTLRLDVGSRIPLAGTASGHALLAGLLEEERESLYKQLARRHAKHWKEISARVREGVAEHGIRGYTTSRGSWMTDINGVAAAIPHAPGSPVVAISCGAPARHLSRAKMEEIGHELRAIAGDLARGPVSTSRNKISLR